MVTTSEKRLMIINLILIIIAPILYFIEFLCFMGLLIGIVFYCSMIAILAISSQWKETKLGKYYVDALTIIPLVYMAILPVVMLLESDRNGGFDFFLEQRLLQYIYLEIGALIITIFTSAVYVKKKKLYAGNLKNNLLSYLSLAWCVRLFWIMVLETKNLRYFALDEPQYMVEYVVLISIPLFWGTFILINNRVLS